MKQREKLIEELKLAVEWAEFGLEQANKAVRRAEADAEDAKITLNAAYRELRKFVSESIEPLEE